MAGAAGLCATAAFLLYDRIDIIPFARGATDIRHEISSLQETLPAEQGDGSVLEEVTFDGRVVTLQFVADERVGMDAWRTRDESRRCQMWKKALRARQVTSVEYRYRAAGSVSSVFIDRAVCG
ncbi:hypothetical protein [Aureimonas sp. AU20]|uniref:hypothetical protein n=1 Tax=Aureimonas sp. AU20 TaxID=1349819 RepID=UPI0011E051E3|nr:hypothetical protein [Aureimonas sp. AU20]